MKEKHENKLNILTYSSSLNEGMQGVREREDTWHVFSQGSWREGWLCHSPRGTTRADLDYWPKELRPALCKMVTPCGY